MAYLPYKYNEAATTPCAPWLRKLNALALAPDFQSLRVHAFWW